MTTLIITAAVFYLLVGVGCVIWLLVLDVFDPGFAAVVEAVMVLIAWWAVTPWQVMCFVKELEKQFALLNGQLDRAKAEYRDRLDTVDSLLDTVTDYEDTLAAIEPYVIWREITDVLDGKYCEIWADALDKAHQRADRKDKIPKGQGYSPTDRWWREGLM